MPNFTRFPWAKRSSALFEKIEDEYDLEIGLAAYEEYLKSDKKTIPMEEVWRELDL